MAELAWPEDIGHGTFTGRFGFMDADSHDPDRAPDITSATGGTVTITPSIKSVRYSGAQGPMILVARPAKGVIDSEGYLCTATADGDAGDRGMVFPATDDTDLTPTDWTYTVSVLLDGDVRIPSFSVKLPAGSTVDLSLAAPVSSSGGTAVVVDPTTAERAEDAAARAEAAADEAEGYAPTFVWDGTKLVIDGGTPVDLKGEQGTTAWGDLTGKPATYPPATHTHPTTDVDGLQATIDRMTVGTGWRNVAAVTTITPEGVLGAGAVSRIKRVGSTVFMEGRGPCGAALLAATMSARPTLANLPAGFTAAGYAPARGFVSHDYGATLGILETFTSPSVVRLNFGTRTTNFTAYLNWSIEFETADAWPTVLPGTPA